MKHPNGEEWIPFLFGEGDAEAKKKLAGHLSECAECAEQLSGWRKSLHRLDHWPVPRQKRRLVPALNPALNLAAAALLVLGLGFGLGRWFSTPADAGQLRAGLENSLRASLLPELRRQVRQEVGSEWQARFDQFQQESASALAHVQAQAVRAAGIETGQAVEQLLSLNRSERAQDQEAAAAWIENLRKRYDADFIALRKDLETVATTAEDRIRAAQLKLIELTAVNPVIDNPK